MAARRRRRTGPIGASEAARRRLSERTLHISRGRGRCRYFAPQRSLVERQPRSGLWLLWRRRPPRRAGHLPGRRCVLQRRAKNAAASRGGSVQARCTGPPAETRSLLDQALSATQSAVPMSVRAVRTPQALVLEDLQSSRQPLGPCLHVGGVGLRGMIIRRPGLNRPRYPALDHLVEFFGESR